MKQIINNIKAFFRAIYDDVAAFVSKAKESIIKAFKAVKTFLAWPTWYHTFSYGIMFLVLVEIIDKGWIMGWFILGFIMWAIRRMK